MSRTATGDRILDDSTSNETQRLQHRDRRREKEPLRRAGGNNAASAAAVAAVNDAHDIQSNGPFPLDGVDMIFIENLPPPPPPLSV